MEALSGFHAAPVFYLPPFQPGKGSFLIMKAVSCNGHARTYGGVTRFFYRFCSVSPPLRSCRPTPPPTPLITGFGMQPATSFWIPTAGAIWALRGSGSHCLWAFSSDPGRLRAGKHSGGMHSMRPMPRCAASPYWFPQPWPTAASVTALSSSIPHTALGMVITLALSRLDWMGGRPLRARLVRPDRRVHPVSQHRNFSPDLLR